MAVLPCPSSAVHVTVVVPGIKTAGASFVKFTVPQLSEPVGVPSATFDAVHPPASAGVLMAAGAVIIGDCVSFTVTVNEQLAVPHEFVAVTATVVTPPENVAPEFLEYDIKGDVPAVIAAG